MAQFCEVCGKGVMSGNNVSHSNRHTKAAWKPNIQSVRALVDGEVKRKRLHSLPAFWQNYPRIIRRDVKDRSVGTVPRCGLFTFCNVFSIFWVKYGRNSIFLAFSVQF